MLAQLNFSEYFIDELTLVANRDYVDDDTNNGTIDVDFDIRRNADNPLNFMVSLMVYINKSDEAFQRGDYKITIKLTGFFSFIDGVDENAINAMIAQNGLSMLYGVARGLVSTASATSWHGKFVLPSVNFIELIKQKAQPKPTPPQKQTRKSKKAL